MTVNVSKPAINVREKLAELDKPTGIAGEAMLRAETPQEQFNLIGAGRRNWIINGSHTINQRGVLPVTGISNSEYEHTDRWLTNITAISGDASLSSGKLKATATSGSSSGYIGFIQRIEDVSILTGKEITVSAKITSNSPEAKIILRSNGTTFGYVKYTGAGQEQLVSGTFVVPSTATSLDMRVKITSTTDLGTDVNTGDYIEFTEAQLELGKVATPFEHRSYGEELALCQRYYEQINGETSYNFIGTGVGTSTTNAVVPIYYTQKRAIPSISSSGTFMLHDGTDKSVTSQFYQHISSTRATGSFTSSNLAAGRAYKVQFHSSGDRNIRIDAEL